MSGPMTHPDADVLAGFHAGLVTRRRADAIAAHLADCDRCAALDGQLGAVPALLGAVPAPAMPETVVRRIEAVLAAEAARRDRSERTRRDRTRERSAPGRVRTRTFARRVLAPAAAVVALAAGGYGLSQIGGGPAISAATAGRPGAPTGLTEPVPSAVGGAASARRRAIAPAASVPVLTSLTPGQLEAVMRAPAAHAPSAQARACAQSMAGRAAPVRVVSARFQDRSVTIVVTRTSTGEMARVAGPRCSATTRDLLATAMLPPPGI